MNTARLAGEIGFHFVDVKHCHGYLGSQLLRPYNDRKWKYGGSSENRTRFLKEIIEGVRSEAPGLVSGCYPLDEYYRSRAEKL